MDLPLPSTVVDPVCGRALSTDVPRPSVRFRGKRFFFCPATPERNCRLAFKRDPDRYAGARPEAGVPLVPAGPAPASRRGIFAVRAAETPPEDVDDS